MSKPLTSLLKSTPVYHQFRKWNKATSANLAVLKWKAQGKPSPPPHLIKQRTIRACGDRYGLRVLVETGTYHGDMVEAMRHHFDAVYSIELSEQLHLKAAARFHGTENVFLIQGDSGVEIERLTKQLTQPALFWLDGHYSAGETARGSVDTPILDELRHIFEAPDLGHVVIIDDARCFGVDEGYPTIDELEAFVLARRPDADFTIVNDGIQIASRRLATAA